METEQIKKNTNLNPPLQQLLPQIENWAKRCIRMAGKEFSVELSKGRRSCDGPNEYHALVIEKEGWQIGSIPLRQSQNGILGYNVRFLYAVPITGIWK